MSQSQSSAQEAPAANSTSTSPLSFHEEPKPASILAPSTPSSTPVNPAEAKRIASMNAKIAALEAQIKETEEKQHEVNRKLKTKDPQATVKAHIKLLHDYNEIRDVGQGLMGIIADNRGVRVSDVYRDFDVGEGD